MPHRSLVALRHDAFSPARGVFVRRLAGRAACWLCAAVAATLLALSAAPAHAQEDGAMSFSADEVGDEGGVGGQVEYERKTTISFDDDTIQGELTKPDVDYIEARKKVRHKSLIRIRESFRDEILGSVADL